MLSLTGPYATGRAITEFFGYKYAEKYTERYNKMNYYDLNILRRISEESQIPGTRAYQIS